MKIFNFTKYGLIKIFKYFNLKKRKKKTEITYLIKIYN